MAFRISNLPTVMLDESRGNIFSRAIVISTILQTLKNIGVVPRGEGGILPKGSLANLCEVREGEPSITE